MDPSIRIRQRLMTSRIQIVPCVLALVVFAGCASTTVTDRQILVNQRLPRPDHILVYDFVATAADVPADSALAGQYSEHSTPQTAEQVAAGRRVGAEIASELAADIQSMGLPGEHASRETLPQINDIVIRGYLLSVNQGNEAERFAIGFGSGASELRTAVEGYQMTPQGLRKLGSGTLDSGGNKSPGAAVGVATLIATGNPAGLIVSSGMKVYGEESGSSKLAGRAKATAQEIADQIKPRFQQQGWIE
jgi:uncharacterized protein DUF4410